MAQTPSPTAPAAVRGASRIRPRLRRRARSRRASRHRDSGSVSTLNIIVQIIATCIEGRRERSAALQCRPEGAGRGLARARGGGRVLRTPQEREPSDECPISAQEPSQPLRHRSRVLLPWGVPCETTDRRRAASPNEPGTGHAGVLRGHVHRVSMRYIVHGTMGSVVYGPVLAMHELRSMLCHDRDQLWDHRQRTVDEQPGRVRVEYDSPSVFLRQQDLLSLAEDWENMVLGSGR